MDRVDIIGCAAHNQNAPPRTTNLIETATQLSPQGGWMLWQQVEMTNLFRALPPMPALNRTLFFRAVRQ
jgi:hypothetical protein